MMIASSLVQSNLSLVPSLEEAKNYIYSIDFSMIIHKLVLQYGWSKKQAEKLSYEYKNFLFLIKKYGEELPPSEEIDEFWHSHILDTQKYREDCEKIFGCYLNHYPYSGMDGESNDSDLINAYRNIEECYLREFGKEMPMITNRFSGLFRVIRRMIIRYKPKR